MVKPPRKCALPDSPQPLLALYGLIDVFRRDHPLFHKTVGNNGRHRAMEEVQDPMVNASQADSQFVDAVSQKVRFGSTPPHASWIPSS